MMGCRKYSKKNYNCLFDNLTVNNNTGLKLICAGCGVNLDESPQLPPDERKPCPVCESKNRHISPMINETSGIHEALKLKGKHKNIKSPFIEIFSGEDFFYKLWKWVTKHRLIDRDQDKYYEEVTDPETGKIIHYTNEKLSTHTGHGSAKEKNNDD